MQFVGTETPQGTAWTSFTMLANTQDNVTGSVFSDQAGSLIVDQSGNGTNWDNSDTVAVSASTGAKINIVIINPYVRVRWTSASPPTIFRVYVHTTATGVKP